MLQRPIDHHTALIFTMVLISAAEGDMTDAELRHDRPAGSLSAGVPRLRPRSSAGGRQELRRAVAQGGRARRRLRHDRRGVVAAPARDGLRAWPATSRPRTARWRTRRPTCSSSCADAWASIAWSPRRSSARPTHGSCTVEARAPMAGRRLGMSLGRDGGVLSIAQMSAPMRRRSPPALPARR